MDGSSIRIFKHQPDDQTSLPGKAIEVLKEDDYGNIWIGTNNGLSCYKKVEKKFLNYYFKESRYGGATNIVTGIVVNSNVVWVSTDGGLFRLDSRSGKFQLLLYGDAEPAFRKEACNKITQMLQDNSGIIWLCTHEGLWAYDPDKNQFRKKISRANDPDYDPLDISAYDADDKLWVGTWGKGLKLFDKRSQKIITYPHHNSNISCLNGVIQPDGAFVLWLNGTLEAFNPSLKTFFKFTTFTGDAPYIKTVFVSADRWIWLCSNHGLYIYNPAAQLFKNKVFKQEVTSQSVVFARLENIFFIGAEGKDILKSYDTTLKAAADYHDVIFKNFNGNKNLAALDLLIESKQSWWMATTEGVVHINAARKSNKWFRHRQKDSSSLPKNFITHLFIDSKKILWIFPWREGVWQMDKLTGRCHQMIDGVSKRAGLVKKLVINDAAEDGACNLWMADLDEGIILYNRITNRFSKPFTDVIGPAPRTFRIYKQGEYLYSIANTVLLKWKDTRHYTTIHFPAEMEEYMYDFAPDKQGNWWFATRNGLIYFNEKKNLFKRFRTSDGLYSNDLSSTLFCRPGGGMIIGGNNYLTSFFPEQITTSSHIVPTLLLTKLTVNGNSLDTYNIRTIDLAYDRNNIFVNWSLPDYTSPFKNQYYCKLQGIDSEWRYVGNRGEVQYASLSPGNYTIMMKAASANGDNTSQDLKIHFIIHFPFWKTAWFYTAVALLLSTVFYFIISKRISRIKAKAALQQQLSELEMKALRAQMNPHFIFNSLNSIQECIVMNNTAAAYEYLNKFSKLVRRILENSGKLLVSLQEEVELLQWYVDLEQLRFKDAILFTINADTHDHTGNIMVPAMIVQPCVENAIWHGLAPKEGKKILNVQFLQKQEGIECTIEDNGIGRQSGFESSERNNKKSMGMSITKQRLKVFNKKARIETHDLLNENGTGRGTKIVIYLPFE